MTSNTLKYLIIVLFAQIAVAQTDFDRAKLDTYFDTIEQHDRFMGSVAVSANGEIIYTRSVGFADIENSIKATDATKYRIGSITKTFTAVLALQAVEQNKLDLNQTIDKWFPSVPNADQITVSHLLSHRSGIHNITNNPDYLTWNTQPKSESEMLEIIAKSGSDFAPDSKEDYSNSNYILLTYILEKIYAKSYAELIQEHIAEPIGLKNTYVFGRIDSGNNESKSYMFIENWKEEFYTDASVPLGAGAITATAADLTRFSDALFGGRLLKAESLETMKNIKYMFGMGLMKFQFNESIGYGHTGGIDGFSSGFSHFEDGGISYAFTSNGTRMNNNDISIAVLSAVYGKPYEIPTYTTYEVAAEELDQYTGVYASEMIPLKITVTKEGNSLIAQATGQPSFPMEPTEKDKFQFEQAGAKFEFFPDEQRMILLQGGAKIEFKKE